MAFPRIPSPNQRYVDEFGDTYEYTTTYGWTALSKTARPSGSIKKKKDRVKYSGSSKITVTSKPPLE